MAQVPEETRLQALASLNMLDTPREERFDRLVRLTKKMFDVPTAVVSLIDEDRWWVKAEAGLDGVTEVPRSQSMCTHAVDADAALVVTDPEHDDRFRDNPFVTAPDGVRFYAGEPLHTPGGVAVGALCIVDTKPRELTEAQLEILRALADFVETELARTDEIDRAGELQRNLLPRNHAEPAGLPGGRRLPAGLRDRRRLLRLARRRGRVPGRAGRRDGQGHPGRADRRRRAVADARRLPLQRPRDRGQPRRLRHRARPHRDLHVRHHAGRAPRPAHRDADVRRRRPRHRGHRHHQGKAEQFDSDGLPLGAPAWEPWRAEQVQLEPGDTFVALSDGALDLFETIDEAREAIRETIVAARDPQEVVDIVATYSKDHHATDDVTCVVIKRNES